MGCVYGVGRVMWRRGGMGNRVWLVMLEWLEWLELLEWLASFESNV